MRSAGAILLDERANGFGRQRAHLQPVIDPLAIDDRPGVGVRHERVIMAELFNHRAVAVGASIHRAQAIERAILAPHPFQTKTYCHEQTPYENLFMLSAAVLITALALLQFFLALFLELLLL